MRARLAGKSGAHDRDRLSPANCGRRVHLNHCVRPTSNKGKEDSSHAQVGRVASLSPCSPHGQGQRSAQGAASLAAGAAGKLKLVPPSPGTRDAKKNSERWKSVECHKKFRRSWSSSSGGGGGGGGGASSERYGCSACGRCARWAGIAQRGGGLGWVGRGRVTSSSRAGMTL